MSQPAIARTPAPNPPQPFEITPEFKRRRTQNWVLLGLLYALFYMSRYNFMATVADLRTQFGWSDADVGLFETVMPLVYGIAVVVNGPIADRIGGKKAFLIGAIGGLVANFLFGLGAIFIDQPAQWAGTGAEKHVVQPVVFAHGMTAHNYLLYLATVWGINGYFQSFGALSIVKVNAHWFHVRERGTFAGIFGVLIRFGLVLGQSVAPLMIAVLGGWQWAYWVPALLLLVMTVLNLKYMENSPEEAGFGEFDTGDGGGDPEEKAPGIFTILGKVFTNPITLRIALASMMVGLVRRSVLDGAWINLYYKEMFTIDRTKVLWHVIYWLSAAMGIAGGFLFGMASDRIYTGRRAPVVVFGFGGMALGLVLLFTAHHLQLGIPATIVAMLLLSFAVNGAHGMIGGAASMDFGGRKAAATAAGLFDGMQYVASAFLGMKVFYPGVPWVKAHWGWAGWMLAPLPFALLGAGIMAMLWNARPGKRGH